MRERGEREEVGHQKASPLCSAPLPLEGNNSKLLRFSFASLRFRSKKQENATHLVHPDLAVRDQPHHQHVPQGFRLPQRVGVAVVHHVEAAVHVHPHRSAGAPAAGVPRQGPREEGRDGSGAVMVLYRGHARFVVGFGREGAAARGSAREGLAAGERVR